MQSVRESCVPRPEVLEGDLEDAIFAADFGHVVEGRAAHVYQDAREFFRNTHPTANLKRLAKTIFARLADKQEAGAAVRLSTGFGGGKTHSLIALWHLAQHIGDPSLGADVLPVAGRPHKVVVVGIDGSKFAAASIWAELALKLGGQTLLDTVTDNRIDLPPASVVQKWLPDAPLLILMDELVVPMSTLDERQRNSFIAFLNLLIAEITARRQAVLVLTDTAGQAAYAREAGELDKLELQAAAGRLDEMLGRKMSDWDPVGNEAAQVIIRRLFDKVDATAAQSASGEYHTAYQRILAEHPEALPPGVGSPDYAARIVQTYPFHPRLLETAQERLGALQDFNKSRGTLRLFARLLRDIWGQGADMALIQAGDVDWQSQRIQADLLDRLNRDNFKAAVSADIVTHAGALDADFSTDIHRRVATALLLESLPLNDNAGMDKRDLGLATLRPSDVGHEAGEAMDRLMAVCWHTYRSDGGERFQFRYEPNVLKLIDERARRGDFLESARQAVFGQVQAYFGGHTFALVAWPSSPRAVADSAQLKLVLCEIESQAQAVCDFQNDDTPDAKQPRRFRNAIFGIAANRDGLHSAVERKRWELAALEVAKEKQREKSVREQIDQQLPGWQKQARIAALRAFNRVVFQGRPAVTLEEKFLVSDNAPMHTSGGQAKLKDFLDENKFIYAPTDALDVDLFLDRIVTGATPALDHAGAYPASAVHERALANASLRLLLNADPVRNTILKAVGAGRMVARLPNGDVYDAQGMVGGPGGDRQRSDGKKLTTLQLASDVLLAPADAPCVADWTRVDPRGDDADRLTVDDAAMMKYVTTAAIQTAVQQGELDTVADKGATYIVRNARFDAWPPTGPDPKDERVAHDWEQAIALAAGKRLTRLTLRATSPDAAKSLLALALPFNAPTLTITVQTGGALKEGGMVNFSASNVKASHSSKPLETAAALHRSMHESATYNAQLALDFTANGANGADNAVARLEHAQAQAEGKVNLTAEFGESV